MLKLGDKAPEFEGVDQNGEQQSLSSYPGKWIVLYFYPKDDTPGCTKEACNFRDSIHTLQAMKVEILGVSKDTEASHKKFAEKYNLNFPIIADPEKKIIQEYDAWGKKKFMGKEFEGTLRKTYLIDPEGKIKKIYENVNPTIHAGEIIRDIDEISSQDK